MTTKYLAIPIEKLIQIPSRFVSERNDEVADKLTVALNEKAEDGFVLITSCKTASGTIFIFKKSD